MSRDPYMPFDETTDNRLDEVKDRVSQVAAKTKDKASQVAGSVSETLNEQREHAAEGLGRAASALHDKASQVPGGPKVVNFTHTVANGMESTATYLREHDFSKMGQDVMNVCRKYPTQAVVAALAFGFLLGRTRR